MRRSQIFCFSVLLIALPLSARAQLRDSSRAAAKTATLSGLVKDEYGDPLTGAEARLQPGNYVMRTDTSGTFRIDAPPGNYNVTFRRLGYSPTDYSWRAEAGVHMELSIRLDPVPQALDTIVIRDRHDRVAGASSIGGVVVDEQFHPVPGVELQLIGTGRHATSYEDGVFFFAGLARGDYVVRARRMGFTPVNLTVKVGGGEAHDVAIKLSALPNTLSTIQVTERSGFGVSAAAWEEFDRRQRWEDAQATTIGRDLLARQGKTPLDWALLRTRAAALIDVPGWLGSDGPTMILPSGTHRDSSANKDAYATADRIRAGPSGTESDVCVLVNGVLAERTSLRAFDASQVERVEVYPDKTDYTGTIGSRMSGVPGCEAVGIRHPLYLVIWMRGGS